MSGKEVDVRRRYKHGFVKEDKPILMMSFFQQKFPLNCNALLKRFFLVLKYFQFFFRVVHLVFHDIAGS